MEGDRPQMIQGFPDVRGTIPAQRQHHRLALPPPQMLTHAFIGADDAGSEEGGQLTENPAHPWPASVARAAVSRTPWPVS